MQAEDLSINLQHGLARLVSDFGLLAESEQLFADQIHVPLLPFQTEDVRPASVPCSSNRPWTGLRRLTSSCHRARCSLLGHRALIACLLRGQRHPRLDDVVVVLAGGAWPDPLDESTCGEVARLDEADRLPVPLL